MTDSPADDLVRSELTPAALRAAAAIIVVQAEERGLQHWVDLADRLTREAALMAALREDENDG